MPGRPGRLSGKERMGKRFLIIWTVVLCLWSAAAAAADKDTDALMWSLRTPVRFEPPPTASLKYSDRVRNPIDQFVLQRLEAEGLEPAPAAERRTLIRRAYFDLLGLPPTPEQVNAFLADQADDAWPRLVD